MEKQNAIPKERSLHKPILEYPTIAHMITHKTKANITQIFNNATNRGIAYQRKVFLRTDFEQTKIHSQRSCQPGSLYVDSVECFNSFSRSPVESARIFLITRRENNRWIFQRKLNYWPTKNSSTIILWGNYDMYEDCLLCCRKGKLNCRLSSPVNITNMQ